LLLTLLLFVALGFSCSACSNHEAQQPETGDPPGSVAVVTLPASTAGDPAPDACEQQAAAWVLDRQVYSSQEFEEPGARTAYMDPVYGTCVVRVSDRGSDLTSDDPSRGLKNEYSRVQSFNADGTLLLLRSIEANWYLYDAQTLAVLGQLPLGVEPRWDSENPHLLYSYDGSRLLALDLETGDQAVRHDFALDLPDLDLAAVWTRYEGSPSNDGSTWGLLAQDEDWHAVALLLYDLRSDQVLSERRLPPGVSIDSVTISPLGTYLLVYHDEICADGIPGDAARPCGLMVYDRDLDRVRNLLPVIGHSDTALDAAGREVLVFQDIEQDELSMLDLESGVVTPLLAIDFSHSPLGFHFSGRAFRRPGWVLVSTYEGARPTRTWMDDVVFALELRPGGRAIRLAATHSVVDSEQEHDYWAEPHATVNADFTRVLFTSNWGRSGSGEVDTFMLLLPPDWLQALP